jgi:hypothetical protein
MSVTDYTNIITPMGEHPTPGQSAASSTPIQSAQLKFNAPVNNALRRQGQFAQFSTNVEMNFSGPAWELLSFGSLVDRALVPLYTWRDQTMNYILAAYPNLFFEITIKYVQYYSERLDKLLGGNKVLALVLLESRASTLTRC